VSAVEDVTSLLVSLLAIVAPLLAAIALILIAFVVVRFIRRVRSRQPAPSSFRR
jgi:flagellar biogenesis protein FliO